MKNKFLTHNTVSYFFMSSLRIFILLILFNQIHIKYKIYYQAIISLGFDSLLLGEEFHLVDLIDVCEEAFDSKIESFMLGFKLLGSDLLKLPLVIDFISKFGLVAALIAQKVENVSHFY